METAPQKSDFISAYNAGRQAVLRTPRWKFYGFIVVGVVIGSSLAKWFVSKHSLPEFKASLLSFIAVAALLGFVFRLTSTVGRGK